MCLLDNCIAFYQSYFRYNHHRIRISKISLGSTSTVDPQDESLFTVGIIGDCKSNIFMQLKLLLSLIFLSFIYNNLLKVHLDPRFMEDNLIGRTHFDSVLKDKDYNPLPNSFLVSLGDLGESKSIHPEISKELFSGTTACFNLAREYFDGFGIPYEVVGGNHDLEGIDEFPTDQSNLEAYLRILRKDTPQFKHLIAEKVMLIGLGSTVFRTSRYTSHEVYIDENQIKWFEEIIKQCPAEDGWRVFVFSHAPPMGSGLRVLQENHVVNGCCWLNHSGHNIGRFIEIVRQNRCIKGWFSGHFHLGQDYEDSITFPEGHNRGSCVFAQTAVMTKKSSRDKRQQSRLLRGTSTGFTISTIDHADEGKVRLDATVTYCGNFSESLVFAYDMPHDALFEHPTKDSWIYVTDDDNDDGEIQVACNDDKTCWWHMADGRVLGMHDGMCLEYDPSTLAPLGLVLGKDELEGKRLAVVDSGIDAEKGWPKMPWREQAVILYDENGHVTVVQPNEDGSYWRKIVRNKVVRMKEKRREKAAIRFIKDNLGIDVVDVKSSWGPYTTTSGTAKATGVPGLTSTVSDKIT